MPLFVHLCHTLCRLCETVTRILGTGVAWLTALMALTTAAIVVARAGFNIGSIAAQESVTYMHALVIALASAYAWQQDGHVRVDILYRQFSPVRQAWVNALGTALLLLPFALFTVLISWQYVANAWAIREGSPDPGGIPAVFLLKTLILVNGLLLMLQGLADLMRHTLTLTTRTPQNSTGTGHA